MANDLAQLRRERAPNLVLQSVRAQRAFLSTLANKLSALRKVFREERGPLKDLTAQMLRQKRLKTLAQRANMPFAELLTLVKTFAGISSNKKHFLRPLLVSWQSREEDDALAKALEDWQPVAKPVEELHAQDQGATVVDYGALPLGHWFANGPSFGLAPVGVGDLRMSDDPRRPLAWVYGQTAAARDAAFAYLRTGAGNSREPGAVTWQQAGKTIRTHSFSLTHSKLFGSFINHSI